MKFTDRGIGARAALDGRAGHRPVRPPATAPAGADPENLPSQSRDDQRRPSPTTARFIRRAKP